MAVVELFGSHHAEVQNLVQDNWTTSNRWNWIIDLKKHVKLEDAGFDWKVLRPDVQGIDFVTWVCDQDAYACNGQKCYAQSILFMHKNWASSGLIPKMKDLAEGRKVEDLTIGPVLTVTTESMQEHIEKLVGIPGVKLLFGGEPLENHYIPKVYGALKPTTVFIPLHEILKDYNFEFMSRETFGSFHIITDYKQDELQMVLDACERIHAIFDIGPLPRHWELHLGDKVAFWAAGNDMNQSIRTNVEESVRNIPPVQFTYVLRKVLKSHEPRKKNEVSKPTKEGNAKERK